MVMQGRIDKELSLSQLLREHQAIEIIKNDENLVIAVMSNCKGGEEYDLLKEVLL